MLIANEGKKTNSVPPRWIQFMTKVNPLWGVSWPFNVTKNWQKKIGILLTLRVGWHTCKRNPCSMLVVARRKYFPLERWELLVGMKKAPWTPSSTKTLIRTSSFRLQKRVFTPWALKWSMRCRYSQACPWISNFSPPSTCHVTRKGWHRDLYKPNLIVQRFAGRTRCCAQFSWFIEFLDVIRLTRLSLLTSWKVSSGKSDVSYKVGPEHQL